MNYAYWSDFLRAYYICLCNHRTHEEAYEAVEILYAKQNKALIDRGHMKPRKYSNYDSFRRTLSYHIQKNKGQL